MSYDVYHIPTNFTDAGRLLGLFELRNTIETALLLFPVIYFCVVLIPFVLTTKIIVTMVIVIPIGGFGLMGINDDSLSRWLGMWWRWRKCRRIMLFRGEVKIK